MASLYQSVTAARLDRLKASTKSNVESSNADQFGFARALGNANTKTSFNASSGSKCQTRQRQDFDLQECRSALEERLRAKKQREDVIPTGLPELRTAYSLDDGNSGEKKLTEQTFATAARYTHETEQLAEWLLANKDAEQQRDWKFEMLDANNNEHKFSINRAPDGAWQAAFSTDPSAEQKKFLAQAMGRLGVAVTWKCV